MAQMDLAGAVAAMRRAHERVATVAVDTMTSQKPAFVGDLVSGHAEIVKVGRSSMTVRIETFVERRLTRAVENVTAAIFTFLATDRDGRPRPVDAAENRA